MTSKELICGFHAVTALLHQNVEQIICLYLLHNRDDQRIQKIVAIAQAKGIKIHLLSRKELDALLPATQHQGVIAECSIAASYTEADLEPLLDKLETPPFVLILDGIQDPHNLGACLRTANAAGIHVVIAPVDHSVGLTPAARKVASGAAEVTPFIQVTNLARTLRMLKDRGIWLFGAAAEGAISVYKADMKGSIAVVLGAEGKGLRRLTRELCDYLISIPMHGSVDSLNVSVATGVCLFEALRQRNSV